VELEGAVQVCVFEGRRRGGGLRGAGVYITWSYRVNARTITGPERGEIALQ
jgi:hypothetical protein